MLDYFLSLFNYNPNSGFVFTKYPFWIFYGVVLGFNALLYKKNILRNAFLFLSSLFFYYKAGGFYFLLLIFSTVVDYFIGLSLYAVNKKTYRRLLLIISLITNLGVLAYFKYSYLFIDFINYLFNTNFKVIDYFSVFSNSVFNTHLDISNIALPVGVSFFTFQTISYSVDVYRRKLKPVKSIVDFGFYVSFFPQLVAGPIVRAIDFIPQLNVPFKLTNSQVWTSVWLIIGGLFKKLIISDYISVNIVDRVFDAPMMYSGLELLLGAYAYTLQIYCDFSGYTDIAIGVALLLGFRLPINFNRPYVASSVTDFWRRWHISLSTWLRDYLYIPLGGNRKGNYRRSINLLITMFLGGLWHGAGVLFILWGALHGFALLIEKAINDTLAKIKVKIPKAIPWLITFHFVVFTWIIFRSSDFQFFKLFIRRIFTAFSIYSYQQIFAGYYKVLIFMFIGFFIHWMPVRYEEALKKRFIDMNLIFKTLLIIIAILLLYQFSLSEVTPFIYFKF